MITTQALKLALGLTAPSIAPRKALSEAIKCVKIDLDPEDKIARITTSNLEQTSRADISYNGSLSASFLIDGEAAKALMRLQCDEIVLSMQKGVLEGHWWSREHCHPNPRQFRIPRHDRAGADGCRCLD